MEGEAAVGTAGSPGQRQIHLAPGLVLQDDPSTRNATEKGAQLGTQPRLNTLVSTCLGARPGLAGEWGTLC